MARTIVKDQLDNIPLGNSLMKRTSGPKAYDCPHFGGQCIGDNCINWTPVGSPQGQQSAQCLIERAGEAVHRRECQRKAANHERWARHYTEHYEKHGNPAALVNRSRARHIAAYWRWLAETAPERAA